MAGPGRLAQVTGGARVSPAPPGSVQRAGPSDRAGPGQSNMRARVTGPSNMRARVTEPARVSPTCGPE